MLAVTPQKPRKLEGKEVILVRCFPDLQGKTPIYLTLSRSSGLHLHRIFRKRLEPILVALLVLTM